MNPTNFPNRKARRRAEAKAREEKYGKLTPQEKLAQAGKKQREKLLKK